MSETEVTLLTGKYTISTSVTKSITISKDATVEISIPENVTLTNTAGKHTITNNGTLTITGSGTVDNVRHERGALVNEPGATATLNGCTFTRSEEAGTDSDHANGNSWYTIKNYGTMTVGKNTVVTTGSSDQVEKYSSLIANGWQNDNDLKSHPKVSGQSTANMTVEGGAFSRGLNTIKNDDYGALTISGGSFTNYTQAALQNHSVATVSNGKFDADSDYAIYNCPCDENADKGELSISGGDFKGTIYSTKADGYGFLKVTAARSPILGFTNTPSREPSTLSCRVTTLATRLFRLAVALQPISTSMGMLWPSLIAGLQHVARLPLPIPATKVSFNRRKCPL